MTVCVSYLGSEEARRPCTIARPEPLPIPSLVIPRSYAPSPTLAWACHDPAMDALDVDRVIGASRELPPAESSYLEDDFVMNLQETVLDYQMHTTAVVRALQHFRDNRWDEIRTLDDLNDVVGRFPEDKEGNTELAQYLWGYNMWTRAQQLRDLVGFFREAGVVDQASLKSWAGQAEFKRDFEGRVFGLGIAVFQWLVMRQGVETVKPDVHVHRFVAGALGRTASDTEVIRLVVEAAEQLGIKAYELDWRIWEASRGGTLPYPTG